MVAQAHIALWKIILYSYSGGNLGTDQSPKQPEIPILEVQPVRHTCVPAEVTEQSSKLKSPALGSPADSPSQYAVH